MSPMAGTRRCEATHVSLIVSVCPTSLQSVSAELTAIATNEPSLRRPEHLQRHIHVWANNCAAVYFQHT